MKIDRIDLLPLVKTAPPYQGERGSDDGQMHVLLRVLTDDGIVGLGSVYTRECLVRASVEVILPHLDDLPADQPMRVRETLDRKLLWEGHGGAVSHTLAGLDIALWDILGKTTGQPIWKLLGGRFRECIRPYASILMSDPARTGERVAAMVERGFRGIKIGWGPFGMGAPSDDQCIVRAAREAAGDDIALMVDAGASEPFWPNDLKWAIETAKMLCDYGIAWFEEPLPPDDIDGYVRLVKASPVPIAGGEFLCRRQQFQPWLDRRAFDIAQPDLTRAGGISECRLVAVRAHDCGVRLIPHGWNTAVGLAADLQLVASLPTADWVEFVTPSPFIDDLIADSFGLDDNGMLAIPNEPGLGLPWNPDGFERHTGLQISV